MPDGPIVALNVARQTFDSYNSVTTNANFGEDKRTRLMMYATGVSSLAANTDAGNDLIVNGVVVPNLMESVTVEAHTQDGRIFQLPREFAGATGWTAGLDQVEVVLIPELQGAGVVDLTIVINGIRSNTGKIVVN